MDLIDIRTNQTFKSEIVIRQGIARDCAGEFCDKKYFLITNTTIKKLYPEIIYKFHKDRIIVIPDGEKYKNFKTFEKIIDELLKMKIERNNCVVALGGGVVGDIAGYCASSVLRGVDLIQIPTTLLAMCDSSIGGKTGINTKSGKNLVGSFYLASKVIIDPEFLNTLNEYEYKCGMGEILKYAFIEKSCKNDQFFNLLEYLETNGVEDVKRSMPYIIKVCASLKSRVVELDRLEGGLRKVLNFGHTFAHPIETLSNYKKISHGEAVSHGMKYAAKLGYNLQKIDEDYYSRMINLIDKFELTSHKVKFKKEKIIALMANDKKVKNSKINLLVPTAPAAVGLFDNIPQLVLEASLP